MSSIHVRELDRLIKQLAEHEREFSNVLVDNGLIGEFGENDEVLRSKVRCVQSILHDLIMLRNRMDFE